MTIKKVAAKFHEANRLFKENEVRKAIEMMQKIEPYAEKNLSIYANLTIFMAAIESCDKGIEYANKALAINPKYIDALSNRAHCYAQQKRYEEAKKDLDLVIEIDNVNSQARYNRAYLDFIAGKYKQGWEDYSFRKPYYGYGHLPIFEWQGESLVGKRLLVIEEQGLGDTLQMVRYHQKLLEQGGEVYWYVTESLQKLFVNNGVSLMGDFPNEEILKIHKIDYYLYSFDLGKVLGITLENLYAPQRYLQANMHLEVNKNLYNIGFVWQGNKNHSRDKHRSILLKSLYPLFELSNTIFYSLQIDEHKEELRQLPFTNIKDASTLINDFNDTAAIIESLDLVITIDTSVAHLAAAMGKPTWILLSYVSDWRWMLDRSDSPWYPTVKLLRQSEEGNWEEVISKARIMLSDILNIVYEGG